MGKEKEVVSQVLTYVDPGGKRDFVQEVTEYFVTQSLGETIRSQQTLYRRVSDRAELKRLNEHEFQVIATGERIVIVDRSLGQSTDY